LATYESKRKSHAKTLKKEAGSGQTWWGEAPERSMNFTKRPGESGWKVLLGLYVRRAAARRWVTARRAYRTNNMIEQDDGCILRVIR